MILKILLLMVQVLILLLISIIRGKALVSLGLLFPLLPLLPLAKYHFNIMFLCLLIIDEYLTWLGL
jgi:hypothetical protein